MHELPTNTPESLRDRYEESLRRGIALAKVHEANRAMEQTERVSRRRVSPELANEQTRIHEELDRGLRFRVDLLQQLEHLRTIEDAFPQVQSVRDASRHDAAVAVEQYLNSSMRVEALVQVVERAKPEQRTLTQNEFRQFLRACDALAEQHGYECLYELPGLDRTLLVLRKGDMVFSLTYLPFRRNMSILEPTRILGIGSRRSQEKELMLSPEAAWKTGGIFFGNGGGWEHACTDPDMQREIDRVIAIFR
jgi:hypothetical protein